MQFLAQSHEEGLTRWSVGSYVSACHVHAAQALYGQPPDWSRYPKALSKLRVGQTNENKEVLKSDLDAIKACVEAFATADPPRLRYLLTVLYDMLREDSSCYSYFDYALSNGIKLDDALTELVNKAPDQYCCDKALNPERMNAHLSNESSPKRKSSGWISRGQPGCHSCGCPGQNTSVRPSKSWNNSHVGADNPRPEGMFSMSPGGSESIGSAKTSG